MKRTLFTSIAILLLKSCSIDSDLTTIASGTTNNGLRTTTSVISKSEIPDFPVDMPDTFFHTFSNGQKFINQRTGPFEHNIDPTGLTMKVSNAITTPPASEILILEGEGNWENGNPDITLDTKQVRMGVYKPNIDFIPIIYINDDPVELFNNGDFWEIFFKPNENGNRIIIDDYDNVHGFGEPGTQTIFYRGEKAEGGVGVKSGLFSVKNEIEVP